MTKNNKHFWVHYLSSISQSLLCCHDSHSHSHCHYAPTTMSSNSPVIQLNVLTIGPTIGLLQCHLSIHNLNIFDSLVSLMLFRSINSCFSSPMYSVAFFSVTCVISHNITLAKGRRGQCLQFSFDGQVSPQLLRREVTQKHTTIDQLFFECVHVFGNFQCTPNASSSMVHLCARLGTQNV